MWEFAGLLRDESTLRQGMEDAGELHSRTRSYRRRRKDQPPPIGSPALVPRLGRHSAISLGPHRKPRRPLSQRLSAAHDDAQFLKHSIFGRERQVVFEAW